MSENECKKEFVEYLSKTFGDDFCEKISVPINVRFGERVAYLLQGEEAGQRKTVSGETLEALESLATELDGKIVEINPLVESGRSEPRMVDLPGWEICFDRPAKRFLDSSEAIPEEGSAIKWLFGVFFGHSNKRLVLIDFLSPDVKGIFSVKYDIDGDLIRSSYKVGNLLIDFFHKLHELKKETVEKTQEIEWIKVVQLEFELTTKTKLTEMD